MVASRKSASEKPGVAISGTLAVVRSKPRRFSHDDSHSSRCCRPRDDRPSVPREVVLYAFHELLMVFARFETRSMIVKRPPSHDQIEYLRRFDPLGENVTAVTPRTLEQRNNVSERLSELADLVLLDRQHSDLINHDCTFVSACGSMAIAILPRKPLFGFSSSAWASGRSASE